MDDQNTTSIEEPEASKGGRKILRESEVKERSGKSRAQRWRDIRAGRFPAPVELGPNSIGWFEDEVEEWLASRPRRTYSAERAA
jgi:prophage regulatory protein